MSSNATHAADPTPGIRAIYAASRRVGWPVAYRSDLELDAGELERRSPARWLWALRECGTCVVPLQDGERRGEALEYVQAIDRTWRGDRCRWYYWTGERLRPLRDGLRAIAIARRHAHGGRTR